jgi:hypothetical protein
VIGLVAAGENQADAEGGLAMPVFPPDFGREREKVLKPRF